LVRVTEVLHLEHAQRLRARLQQPKGWITLRNPETGRRLGGLGGWGSLTICNFKFDLSC
jgi:hypothetical protein